LDPPDLVSMTAAAYSSFHGKVIGPFRFSHQGKYIGRRAVSEGGPRAHAMAWPGVGPRHGVVWPPSGAPPSHHQTLSRVGKNRNSGFCFIQF
jgi:hypothetical protein